MCGCMTIAMDFIDANGDNKQVQGNNMQPRIVINRSKTLRDLVPANEPPFRNAYGFDYWSIVTNSKQNIIT